MNQLSNVVIVMARCGRNGQEFGIRFEEKTHGRWIGDWAFAIKEKTAQREGYDRGEITGAFGFDVAYPGCPHCRAPSIFRCDCGKVACWDGERHTVTCPWCKTTIELGGEVKSLSAGGDR